LHWLRVKYIKTVKSRRQR